MNNSCRKCTARRRPREDKAAAIRRTVPVHDAAVSVGRTGPYPGPFYPVAFVPERKENFYGDGEPRVVMIRER